MSQPLPNWNEIVTRVPSAALGMISILLASYPCRFVLARKRNSKFGDFQAGPEPEEPVISVNHDLPESLFLITLVHEIAHVVVWHRHGRDVASHGQEWKQAYRECLTPFIRSDIFPEELLSILHDHIREAPATTRHNTPLYHYFFPATDSPILKDLPGNAVFRLTSGRTFRLISRKRSRFECLDLGNQRHYLIPGDAPVVLLDSAV